DTVYETTSTEINGPFDHFENFEHLGDLAVDVAAILAEQPVASFTSTSTSEILNFDPQMPDAKTFNMAPAPHAGLPANLADTTESVDSTLA
ncbi:hypothetical protein ABI057_15510, partial [Enterococcus faecium]|uniref:hypothetical protein n=1 Tax=Enterococcus faecium TaxID=1352 RepID=UPI003F441EC7